MRLARVAASTAAAVALVMGGAAPALAQDDLNCGDFATQAEAQAEFEAHDEDVYNLDGDADGIACEALPSGQDGGGGGTEDGAAQDDLNCEDFATQTEAQAEFESHDEDIYNLDADADGIACEALPAGDNGGGGGTGDGAADSDQTGGQAEDDEQVEKVPEGGVQTGGGSTAGLEHAGLLGLGTAMIVAAGGGLIASRKPRWHED